MEKARFKNTPEEGIPEEEILDDDNDETLQDPRGISKAGAT